MRRRQFVSLFAAGLTTGLPVHGMPCRPRLPLHPPLRFVERWSWAMGQPVRVCIFHESEDAGLEAAQAALAELRRLEGVLSRFDDASALSELHRHAGGPAWRAPAELVEVLLAAARARRTTAGAFDIAVEPLMRAWGFRELRRTAPTAAELAEAETAVRASTIEVVGQRVRLPASHTRLDLSGIGVGHALDSAGAVLRRREVSTALLDVSGDLLALGGPPGASGWAVDIADSSRRGVWVASTLIRDCALATSALHGSDVRYGDVTHGHLMDPRGEGAARPMRQATVVARTAVLADALSTAAVVTGRPAQGVERSWLLA